MSYKKDTYEANLAKQAAADAEEWAMRNKERADRLLSRVGNSHSVIKGLYDGSMSRVGQKELGIASADLGELQNSRRRDLTAKRESGDCDAKVLAYGSGLRNFFDSKQPNVLSVDPAAHPQAWLPYYDVGVNSKLYHQSITITGDLAGLSAEAQRALLARVFSVYKEVSFKEMTMTPDLVAALSAAHVSPDSRRPALSFIDILGVEEPKVLMDLVQPPAASGAAAAAAASSAPVSHSSGCVCVELRRSKISVRLSTDTVPSLHVSEHDATDEAAVARLERVAGAFSEASGPVSLSFDGGRFAVPHVPAGIGALSLSGTQLVLSDAVSLGGLLSAGLAVFKVKDITYPPEFPFAKILREAVIPQVRTLSLAGNCGLSLKQLVSVVEAMKDSLSLTKVKLNEIEIVGISKRHQEWMSEVVRRVTDRNENLAKFEAMHAELKAFMAESAAWVVTAESLIQFKTAFEQAKALDEHFWPDFPKDDVKGMIKGFTEAMQSKKTYTVAELELVVKAIELSDHLRFEPQPVLDMLEILLDYTSPGNTESMGRLIDRFQAATVALSEREPTVVPDSSASADAAAASSGADALSTYETSVRVPLRIASRLMRDAVRVIASKINLMKVGPAMTKTFPQLLENFKAASTFADRHVAFEALGKPLHTELTDVLFPGLRDLLSRLMTQFSDQVARRDKRVGAVSRGKVGSALLAIPGEVDVPSVASASSAPTAVIGGRVGPAPSAPCAKEDDVASVAASGAGAENQHSVWVGAWQAAHNNGGVDLRRQLPAAPTHQVPPAAPTGQVPPAAPTHQVSQEEVFAL